MTQSRIVSGSVLLLAALAFAGCGSEQPLAPGSSTVTVQRQGTNADAGRMDASGVCPSMDDLCAMGADVLRQACPPGADWQNHPDYLDCARNVTDQFLAGYADCFSAQDLQKVRMCILSGAAGSSGGLPDVAQAPAFLYGWGSRGSGNGQFTYPSDVVVSRTGDVYVSSNQRVQRFTRQGDYVGGWGTSGSAPGQFNTPVGLAMDGDGNVYVLEHQNHRVQVFDPNGVLLHVWGSQGSGPGQFYFPTGLDVDGHGNVYVADRGNSRIEILASDGSYAGEWPAASAYDVAVGRSGLVYVAMAGVQAKVRVFGASGSPVREWGLRLPGDGSFPVSPHIALDAQDNVYVVNDAEHRVQVHSPVGALMAVWGSEGDGERQFEFPAGLGLDTSGRVYVADESNHRVQVFSSIRGDHGNRRLDVQ